MQVMGNQIYWQTKPSIPSTIGCYRIPYREGDRLIEIATNTGGHRGLVLKPQM